MNHSKCLSTPRAPKKRLQCDRNGARRPGPVLRGAQYSGGCVKVNSECRHATALIRNSHPDATAVAHRLERSAFLKLPDDGVPVPDHELQNLDCVLHVLEHPRRVLEFPA